MVTIGLLALFLTFFLLQDGEKGWGRAMQVTEGWRGSGSTRPVARP